MSTFCTPVFFLAGMILFAARSERHVSRDLQAEMQLRRGYYLRPAAVPTRTYVRRTTPPLVALAAQ